MFRVGIAICALALVLGGCGGGGGSSRAPAPTTNNPPVPVNEGPLTLQLGDNALDGLHAVVITISGVVLIGADGQIELALEEVPTVIDLLALQNLTETLFEGNVPAGDYSKIRLEIDGLQVFESEGGDPVDVQVPSGKIDLNPQGQFSIIPGEELVIEIDIALDRAIHIVTTGNSRYRFRPVVFVDILDQSDRPRMTRIFGEVFALQAAGEPFDLCEPMNAQDCYDITVPETLTIVGDDDSAQEGLEAGSLYHMFGVYFVDDSGEAERLRFRPILAIEAAEDGIDSAFGNVSNSVLQSDFFLDGPDESDYEVVRNDPSLVLDRYGDEANAELGDVAEVWGRTPLTSPLNAMLIIVRPDEDGDSVEGDLLGVDGSQLNLSDSQCVLVDQETEFQLVTIEGDTAESASSDLDTIASLTGSVEIAAFGQAGAFCLDASFVVATVDPT